MANEAVLIYETHIPIPMTCANGTGIEKGAVLKLSDPITAAITAGAADTCGGIAAEEKIASDGKIKIPVYRGGIFRVFVSGSVTAGDPATTDTSVNYFKSAVALTDNALSGSRIWGIFLETATTGETALMELRPQSQSSGV